MQIQIQQAARNADRLDTLNALLSGDADAWCRVSIPRTDAKRGNVIVEVKIDALAVEERNRSNLLRQQLATIAALRGTQPPTPPAPADDDLNLD